MRLKEFARLVGMSQTTVSRALNGHPEVNEQTRARLVAAAREHGYSPNAHARFLAMGRAPVISCVIPITGRNEIVSPIYADFLAGVGEECAQRKYEINLTVLPDDEQEAAYRSLKSRQMVGGVIVQFTRHDDPRPALLDKLGMPYVVHGRVSGRSEPYSWVDVNNRRAFERAAGFLIQLGHKHIALINGDERMDFAHRRREGYLNALRDAGLEPGPDMPGGEMTVAHGYAATRHLLQQHPRPTAILCSSTMIAEGVRQAAQESGLQLGRDLSLVCFDDDLSYYSNRDAVPEFTAMRSSVRLAGQRIAAMLINRIETDDPTPVQELLEAELVVGRSTAPPVC